MYDPIRKVYNQESIETNGFPTTFRIDDSNDLYERRWDPRRPTLVHSQYTLQGPRIPRRQRPVISASPSFVRPKIIGTPFVRKTQFRRKIFPRKNLVRVFPRERIPSIDLQGLSKSDQFRFVNPEENSVFDSNVEARPIDPNNGLEPLRNGKNVKPTQSKNTDKKEKEGNKVNVDGKQASSGKQDTVSSDAMPSGFLDTSIYTDSDVLSSTGKADSLYHPLNPRYDVPKYDPYLDTINDGNSLIVQDIRNAFTLKEVLANMKLYQDKYNEQEFRKMKKLNKIAKSRQEYSEPSLELPLPANTGQENMLPEKGGNNTHQLQGNNEISSYLPVTNEKKASAFYKTDKIVTIKEENMNGKNNMPGKETVVEINGKGNGHSNYTVQKGNDTYNSGDFKSEEYSITPVDVTERLNKSENGVVSNTLNGKSNKVMNGPSMTINLDENTTMTIPLAMEGAEGTILKDAIMKSTVETIPKTKDKSSESFTVINVPVLSNENSVVKGITFKVPTKVGKFFKIMSSKDSIDL